jgi:hypothetical protein
MEVVHKFIQESLRLKNPTHSFFNNFMILILEKLFNLANVCNKSVTYDRVSATFTVFRS